MFGDRGGQRRYDRTGFFMLTQLERNGRANDGLLPLVGRCEAANPAPPLIDRLVEHRFQTAADFPDKALIGTKEKIERPLNAKQALILKPADRRGGRKSQYAAV